MPVSALDSFDRLKTEVDEMICLEAHEDFYAVGQFYKKFGQVSDEEAKRILNSES